MPELLQDEAIVAFQKQYMNPTAVEQIHRVSPQLSTSLGAFSVESVLTDEALRAVNNPLVEGAEKRLEIGEGLVRLMSGISRLYVDEEAAQYRVIREETFPIRRALAPGKALEPRRSVGGTHVGIFNLCVDGEQTWQIGHHQIKAIANQLLVIKGDIDAVNGVPASPVYGTHARQSIDGRSMTNPCRTSVTVSHNRRRSGREHTIPAKWSEVPEFLGVVSSALVKEPRQTPFP